MQGHDGLAGSGRARHSGRSREGTLNEIGLGGMKEHCPFVPRVIQGLLQFFGVGQHTESALGVGVCKRVGFNRSRFGRLRFLAHGQLQQRFLCLLWQVLDDVEQRVLGSRPDVVHPFLGNAKGHKFEFAQVVEQASGRFGGRCRGDHLPRLEDLYLFDPFANLDQLHGAGGRVAFDLAAFGPFVGVVVVIDIDQQDAGRRAMDDYSDVCVHPYRPEVRVFGAVKLVERQPVRGRVELQVEGRGLDGLLLLRGQAPETIGEGVGDPESQTIGLYFSVKSRPGRINIHGKTISIGILPLKR